MRITNERVERVSPAVLAALLQDPDADPAAVRAALDAADDATLGAYGLRGVYLNQLSAYRRWWARERIRSIAAATVRERLWGEWEFAAYVTRYRREVLSRGGDAAVRRGWVRLEGWDSERIAALADEAGGGLVICTFHIGPFRFLPLDLYNLGFSVTVPLNRSAYQELFTLGWGMEEEVQQRIGLRPVDEPTSTLALARALRRGGLVLAYVDGNIGADGVTGEDVRSPVEFCGLRLRVKSGIPRLAAALGATLLPVTAERRGDRLCVRLEEPIRPAGRLKGEAQEAFAAEATQRLYAVLEERVREVPDQWVSAAFLHRWREPEPVTLDRDAPSPEALRRHLEGGGVLRLDPDRIVDVGGDEGPILADVRTLRAVRVPDWAAATVQALGSERGFGADELEALDVAAAERTLAFAAGLAARGMIVAHGGPRTERLLQHERHDLRVEAQ